MCGIAGLIQAGHNREQLVAKGKAMMDTLVHRGPDSGGLWHDEQQGLVLCHRRLAIQDLSEHGEQPMFSASKRYVTVFNGEIYNFKELATSLGQNGYQFNGHSDTEVLLAAIELWGLDRAVKQFVGMYAFALWDCREKKLYLCRDRIGEKPLYYGWLDDGVYFASELKAIVKIVSKDKLEIDYEGLSSYLRYGYISEPLSIYRGIYKLPSGSILSFDLNNSGAKAFTKPSNYSPYTDTNTNSPLSYWSLKGSANDGLKNVIMGEDQVITELDTLLQRTIARQMISDVNIGTFLSGGIDSTVVSAIAQQVSGEKLKTYTIGFSQKEYDESKYAEAIARHLGTDHLTMQVTPNDALDVVPNLPEIYDEPFADSSQIPVFLVSKLAKEHVTVCLSGDGGDELFAGYNRYIWTESIWKKLALIPLPLRKIMGQTLAMTSPSMWDHFYHIVSRLSSNKKVSQKLVGLKIQKIAGLMQKQSVMQVYDYLLSYWEQPESLINFDKPEQIQKQIDSGLNSDNFINQAMFIDQNIYLQGDNLVKVDRASMAVSLETRLPLLSHEVIDFSWRIPVNMKVRKRVSKWVLRRVLDKYVPDDLIERPKMGFSVPVAQWLRADLKNWAEDLLHTMDSSSVLCKETIHRVWHEHQSGRYDHSHRLWTVLMFLAWNKGRI
jgi:asparagine synthase (glutamine-hydrolysing)